ncbi:MAG: Urea carboxylase-related aminomethyltransferase [Frankiales bacterium]|nr:Urea carboxylase-related aminomethyltransferase [Frankiales bacterium]
MTLLSPPLVLTEQVPGGAAWSLVLRRHEVLRLEALAPGANVSLLLAPVDRPFEKLCVPDTLKAQMQARVRPPMALVSDTGRALASVVGSSLDWHDCLTGHSTDAHVRERFGPSDYATDRNGWRQSARAGLLDELRKHGLDERDLAPTVNLFTKVATSSDDRGSLAYVPGHAVAGDWVELRAELDVLVVLSTAPHPMDPRTDWAPSPVDVQVRRGDPPGTEDATRTFRPESGRALAETERSVR